MGFFRVKRSEDNKEFGHIEAFMTNEGKYGRPHEASLFGSRKAAEKALRNDKWNHTGDYRYDIEEWDE